MGLDHGARLREECWSSITGRVRARLEELTGPTLGWWAKEDSYATDSRCRAIVLGEQGLCIADPRINTEHRPVYAITGYLLDPASFRNMRIDHRPAPRQDTPGSGSPGGQMLDSGLTAAAQGMLGNLPPRAQELLQVPFLGGQRVRDCDWHYEGSEHHLKMFMIFLAGQQDVTAAVGHKVVPVGHTAQTAHWSLTCYRASVIRRIGR
jgi:hypothetical protein